MNAEIAEKAKTMLEHAPLDAQQNPDIKGWVLNDPAGSEYICNDCAARIMARGCRLPGDGQAIPVWDDPQIVTHHVCCTCGMIEPAIQKAENHKE